MCKSVATSSRKFIKLSAAALTKNTLCSIQTEEEEEASV